MLLSKWELYAYAAHMSKEWGTDTLYSDFMLVMKDNSFYNDPRFFMGSVEALTEHYCLMHIGAQEKEHLTLLLEELYPRYLGESLAGSFDDWPSVKEQTDKYYKHYFADQRLLSEDVKNETFNRLYSFAQQLGEEKLAAIKRMIKFYENELTVAHALMSQK